MGALIQSTGGHIIPGTIAYFAGNAAPPGWLVCDGSVISSATYRALYAAIGATYGEQSNNVLLFPRAFDNAAWTKATGQLVVLPDNANGFDGTPVADKITTTFEFGDSIFCTSALPIVNGQQNTASVYIRPDVGTSRVALMLGSSGGGSSGVSAVFDFNTVSTLSHNQFNATLISATIDPAANGFYRCRVSGQWGPGLGGNTARMILAFNTPIMGAFWADAAQLELGSVMTDYGVSNFSLPDLRGEFLRGFDSGRGIDAGRVFGSAQADAFKSHTHSFPVYFNTSDSLPICGGTGPSWSTGNTNATGGTETRPRNIAMLPCIKF